MSEQWTTHDSNLSLYDCLSEARGRRPSLPPELIFLILAQRSRWILLSTESFILDSNPAPEGHRIHYYEGDDTEPIVSTRKLSRQEALHLEEVVFYFRSRDQGWSHDRRNHGTYNGSCTWMEAGIIASDGDLPANDERCRLQANRHADSNPEDYTIRLDENHDLLDSMEEGDSIGLWARAMYPAWQNFVYEAKIDLWFHGPDKLQELPS